MMQFTHKKELSASDKLHLMELWNNEYPEKLAYAGIDAFEVYLENLKDQRHILMCDENNNIQGWYFQFTRENETWFAIIIDSKCQGAGMGTQLLDMAKEQVEQLSGWVIDHNGDIKKNGEFYTSPLNFYLKNGFQLISETRLELDFISAVKIQWVKPHDD